jgi:Macrocin-O-methyltransferase (TylF)
MAMNLQPLLHKAYCSSIGVLQLTEQLCLDVIKNNIPGDFAEAGVARGIHGIVMNSVAKDQKVWLFDSFEGISKHGPEDKEWTDVHGVREEADPRSSGGITSHSIAEVRQHIFSAGQTMENFRFVKGWFIDTLPHLDPNLKFSVLRLDCDLYSPYMDCFKYLLPKLSVGGYLLLDDIVLSGCKQAITDSGLHISDFTIDENKMAFMHWTPFKISRWKEAKNINNGHH